MRHPIESAAWFFCRGEFVLDGLDSRERYEKENTK